MPVTRLTKMKKQKKQKKSKTQQKRTAKGTFAAPLLPKKKMGRKPLNVTAVDDVVVLVTDVFANSVAVVADEAVDLDAGSGEEIKRKRGRPTKEEIVRRKRKLVDGDVNVVSDSVPGEKTKKKRGRPRKETSTPCKKQKLDPYEITFEQQFNLVPADSQHTQVFNVAFELAPENPENPFERHYQIVGGQDFEVEVQNGWHHQNPHWVEDQSVPGTSSLQQQQPHREVTPIQDQQEEGAEAESPNYATNSVKLHDLFDVSRRATEVAKQVFHQIEKFPFAPPLLQMVNTEDEAFECLSVLVVHEAKRPIDEQIVTDLIREKEKQSSRVGYVELFAEVAQIVNARREEQRRALEELSNRSYSEYFNRSLVGGQMEPIDPNLMNIGGHLVPIQPENHLHFQNGWGLENQHDMDFHALPEPANQQPDEFAENVVAPDQMQPFQYEQAHPVEEVEDMQEVTEKEEEEEKKEEGTDDVEDVADEEITQESEDEEETYSEEKKEGVDEEEKEEEEDVDDEEDTQESEDEEETDNEEKIEDVDEEEEEEEEDVDNEKDEKESEDKEDVDDEEEEEDFGEEEEDEEEEDTEDVDDEEYQNAEEPVVPEPTNHRQLAHQYHYWMMNTFHTEEVVFNYPSTRMRRIPNVTLYAKSLLNLSTGFKDGWVDDPVMLICLSEIVLEFEKSDKKTVYLCDTTVFLNIDIGQLIRPPRDCTKTYEERVADYNARVVKSAKWLEKDNIVFTDLLVLPIIRNKHWCIAFIVDLKNSLRDSDGRTSVIFYNPMSAMNTRVASECERSIRNFLQQLVETKMPGQYDSEKIDFVAPIDGPVQNNFMDCGPFVIEFTKQFLMTKESLTRVLTESWSDVFEWSNQMAGLSREKMFQTIYHLCPRENRSRLDQFMKSRKTGMDVKNPARRTRRHSGPAGRRTRRHPGIHWRHYSVNPFDGDGFCDGKHPDYLNPRKLVEMDIIKRVRALEQPKYALFY